MRTPAIVFVLTSLIGSACTPAHQGSVEPDTPAPTQANSALAVEDPGTKPSGTIELQPIALREGTMTLAEAGGRPYLLIDGEPIPLEPGRAPTRVAALGHGLAPIESMFGPMFEVVGLGGALSEGSGVLVVREDFDRAGSAHHTYELTPDGWRLRSRTRHAMLDEYYLGLVTTAEGALLGLRGYELSADSASYEYTDDSLLSTKFWAKVEAELETAPTGFVALSGPSAAVMPALPDNWSVRSIRSTRSGQLVALAQAADPDDRNSLGPVQLLEWAPGSTTPDIHGLPDLGEATLDSYTVGLWPAGERVIVSGMIDPHEDQPGQAYLAVGAGSDWTRVPVNLPDAEAATRPIMAATISEGGELWVVSERWDHDEAGGTSNLWRQTGGGWEAVPLPAIDALVRDVDARERWVYDPLAGEWFAALPGEAPSQAPIATSVSWSNGALWVVASVGTAYPTAKELYIGEQRSVVYASRASDTPESAVVAWLPGFDRLQLERVDRAARARPEAAVGGEGCHDFSIVVHDRADSDEGRALATRLAPAELPSIDGAGTRDLFGGSLVDDPSGIQLVYSAYANSASDAKRLLGQVGKLAKVSAKADCRPRVFVQSFE